MDLIFFFFFLSSNVSRLFTASTQLFGLDKEKEGEQEGAVCFDSAKEGTSKRATRATLLSQ